MKIGAATSVGKMRDHNEDSFWVGEDIFVVCDGMGGHQAGEIASALAAETIRDFEFPRQNPVQEVSQAIEKAHQQIVRHAQAHSLEGMGTTLTMAMVQPASSGYELVIGHVGDSRAYLWQEGNLEQLTQDHSIVGELLRNGTLSVGEAETHPHRNVLTQALGIGRIVVEICQRRVSSGARLLLCTDGLTAVVRNNTIGKILAENEPQSAADLLIDLANQGGGPDNITVIVVQFP